MHRHRDILRCPFKGHCGGQQTGQTLTQYTLYILKLKLQFKNSPEIKLQFKHMFKRIELETINYLLTLKIHFCIYNWKLQF